MDLNSKIFDRIRIRRRTPKRKTESQVMTCEWAGCDLPGTHRAPKGRSNDGFFMFCLEHVRQYNQSYNYFAEMNAEEIEEYILRNSFSSTVGPDWQTNGRRAEARASTNHRRRDWSGRRINDPFNIFARYARAQARNPFRERERRILEADRRALEMLGLDGRPDRNQIKAAYKSMVKKHHPDANGGDKGSEERLRNIIAAYTHLKSKGFA